VPDLRSDLLACLDVHPVLSGDTGEERAGDDVTEFEGRNQQLDYHRVFPVGNPRGRRPQRNHHRPAAVRGLDAHPDRRPAAGTHARCLCHGPDAHRYRAAAHGRCRAAGNGTAFASAVTSHTIWFHRPFRTDRWLLLRQHSPLLAHGRSFGRGDMLAEDGKLVASYAQEALLRFAS
jgi:acyl-CoA thioesterase